MADTREEILRTAGRMLQLKGFNAFSFANVAEALFVKPAAIHYHFPTKADLGVALINRYRARYRQAMEDGETLSVRENLEGFFGIFERFARDGRVCFEGVLEAELNAVPKPVQDALREMVEEVNVWLARLLERGKKAGELDFEGSAEDVAAMTQATVQGALQVARLRGKHVYDAAMRQVRRQLGMA